MRFLPTFNWRTLGHKSFSFKITCLGILFILLELVFWLAGCAEGEDLNLAVDLCQSSTQSAALKPVVTEVTFLGDNLVQLSGDNLKSIRGNPLVSLKCTAVSCGDMSWELQMAADYAVDKGNLTVELPATIPAGTYSLVIDNQCAVADKQIALRSASSTGNSDNCQLIKSDAANQLIWRCPNAPDVLIPLNSNSSVDSGQTASASRTCVIQNIVQNSGETTAKIICGPQSLLNDGTENVVTEVTVKPYESSFLPLPANVTPIVDPTTHIKYIVLDNPENLANYWTYYDSVNTCRQYGYKLCSIEQIYNLRNALPRLDIARWVEGGSCSTPTDALMTFDLKAWVVYVSYNRERNGVVNNSVIINCVKMDEAVFNIANDPNRDFYIQPPICCD